MTERDGRAAARDWAQLAVNTVHDGPQLDAARATLAAEGYVVVADVLPPATLRAVRRGVRDWMMRLCAYRYDIVCARPCADATSYLRTFGPGAADGRIDVYHCPVHNALRQNEHLVSLFERLTGVEARWMLHDSAYLRLDDGVVSMQRQTPPQPLFNYDRTTQRRIYDAPYHAYLFLTSHTDTTKAASGVLEVVPHSRLTPGSATHNDVFLRFPAATSAIMSPGVLNNRSYWLPQRGNGVERPYIQRVAVAAGSLVVVASSTLHALTESNYSVVAPDAVAAAEEAIGAASALTAAAATPAELPRYGKVVLPLTYLPDTPLNAEWARHRQYPAYMLGSAPYLAVRPADANGVVWPAVPTAEARALAPGATWRAGDLPFAYNRLGRRLVGLEETPASPPPPPAAAMSD